MSEEQYQAGIEDKTKWALDQINFIHKNEIQKDYNNITAISAGAYVLFFTIWTQLNSTHVIDKHTSVNSAKWVWISLSLFTIREILIALWHMRDNSEINQTFIFKLVPSYLTSIPCFDTLFWCYILSAVIGVMTLLSII